MSQPLELRYSPGQVLGERYQLDRVLGEGGMGLVWAARHTITSKPVAIKILKAQGDEVRRRFIREAKVASTIRHPNVIDVHDVLELDNGQPAMVMDLLDGEPLSDRLERESKLSVETLATVFLPVLAAVSTAHAAGVVHRDLKPENIFLCGDAPGRIDDVRVLDFGIAKLTATERNINHSTKLTQTGSVLGTPTYMAPEQVFGEKSIDHRADIWTLGVIVYECVSGQCPIAGDNVGQIFKSITQARIQSLASVAPDVPAPLVSVVDAMLQRDVDDRLDSVEPLARALAESTGQPMPSIVPPRSVRPSRGPLKQLTPGAMATTMTAKSGTGQPGRRWAALAAVATAIVLVGVSAATVGPASTPAAPPLDGPTPTKAEAPAAAPNKAPATDETRPKPTQPAAPASSEDDGIAAEEVAVPSSSAPPRPFNGHLAKKSPAHNTSGDGAEQGQVPAQAEPTPTLQNDKATKSTTAPGGLYEQSPYTP